MALRLSLTPCCAVGSVSFSGSARPVSWLAAGATSCQHEVSPTSSQEEVAMVSIAKALERIKGTVTQTIPEDLIVELCREVGYHWRDRDLGPVITTHLFLRQILEGNVPVGELRRQTGLCFTDSAYCQARARLPRQVLDRLQRAVAEAVDALTEPRPAD